MKALIEFIGLWISKFTRSTSVAPVETKIEEVKIDDIEAMKEYQEENLELRSQFFEGIKYKNNSERMAKEHLALAIHNDELGEVLEEVNAYTNRNFKKPILLTQIFRTQAEQDYLYRDSSKYKKKKFISPHQLWHGADLRSSMFTRAEIDQLVKYINKRYDATNYYKATAQYHQVGTNGWHFHIQYLDKFNNLA